MNYEERYKDVIAKEQAKLKKYKISYFYLATGMEGNPDIFPEKIIEAPCKELAVFIYHLMFFSETNLKSIEAIRSYGGKSYSMKSFEEYLKEEDVYKYWGTSVEEVS